ncbi:MAG TPA: ABC transporter ATP-binding protein [bacterium]|nr:ABC transporter ATP-binding protein [bacterium]
MPPAISVHELAKRYRTTHRSDRAALLGLTLDVPPGEIYGFLGPNGAGKTTTIKLLLGLIRPTGGGGAVLGHALGSVDARRRVGFLPESPYFYEYLRGEELLHYYGSLFGLAERVRRGRVEELLRLVGLWDERRLAVRKYSRGMLQRLGLAQALVNDPDLVILDEPAGGLDPIGRREMRDILLQLRERGKTVFLSSHILAEVETVCDRVAILNRGELVAVGRIGDLLAGGREMELTIHGANGSLSRHIEAIPGATIHHGTDATVVVVPEQRFVYPIIDLVRQTGGQIVALHAKRERLEDVFVKLVGGRGGTAGAAAAPAQADRV